MHNAKRSPYGGMSRSPEDKGFRRGDFKCLFDVELHHGPLGDIRLAIR